MKELYIAPEINLIGFVASEKIAAQEGLSVLDHITLSNITSVSKTDIKIPIPKIKLT